MLLKAFLIAAAAAAPAWKLGVGDDPIDDKPYTYAILESGRDTLLIGCDMSRDPEVTVTLETNKWLGGANRFTGEKLILYRFDDLRPVENIWIQTSQAATLREPQRVTPFLKALVSSRRLVVRTRDDRYQDIDFIFDLGNPIPAVRRMLERCGDAKLASAVLPPP